MASIPQPVNHNIVWLNWTVHGPLARYVKLRVAHAPGMLGTLTNGSLWSRWRGKRSRHSRRNKIEEKVIKIQNILSVKQCCLRNGVNNLSLYLLIGPALIECCSVFLVVMVTMLHLANYCLVSAVINHSKWFSILRGPSDIFTLPWVEFNSVPYPCYLIIHGVRRIQNEQVAHS